MSFALFFRKIPVAFTNWGNCYFTVHFLQDRPFTLFEQDTSLRGMLFVHLITFSLQAFILFQYLLCFTFLLHAYLLYYVLSSQQCALLSIFDGKLSNIKNLLYARSTFLIVLFLLLFKYYEQKQINKKNILKIVIIIINKKSFFFRRQAREFQSTPVGRKFRAFFLAFFQN